MSTYVAGKEYSAESLTTELLNTKLGNSTVQLDFNSLTREQLVKFARIQTAVLADVKEALNDSQTELSVTKQKDIDAQTKARIIEEFGISSTVWDSLLNNKTRTAMEILAKTATKPVNEIMFIDAINKIKQISQQAINGHIRKMLAKGVLYRPKGSKPYPIYWVPDNQRAYFAPINRAMLDNSMYEEAEEDALSRLQKLGIL